MFVLETEDSEVSDDALDLEEFSASEAVADAEAEADSDAEREFSDMFVFFLLEPVPFLIDFRI